VLQLHIITGLGLEKRGMEIKKDDLTFRTGAIVRKGEIDQHAFDRFVEDVTQQYQGRSGRNKTVEPKQSNQ